MLDNRAVEVKAIKNYLLLIRFSDDSLRIYNCHCLLQHKLYAELSDWTFFQTVQIDDMGIICWDDALDIHPDDAYDNSIPVNEFHF
jgi:hypothetical protein